MADSSADPGAVDLSADPGVADSPADPGVADSTAAPGTAHIDWEGLRARAVEMTGRAYAPYSDFQVGVAGLVDNGRVVVGCNVENAAYGVALCAECGMVSALHASGGGRLVAVACVDKLGTALMPCGRCRQLLWENGGPGCLLDTPLGIQTMEQVLPQAFGVDELVRVAEGVEQERVVDEERGAS